MRALVEKISGTKAYSFISKFSNPEDPETLVVHTTNDFNILNHSGKIRDVINLGKVNDIRYINKFFEGVNSRLEVGGLFVCRFETFTARRKRKTIGKIPVLRTIYFAFEFIFMRIFPKVPGLKKIYFFITRGHNRLLSKAETLGRLVSCGFSIEECQSFDGYAYVIAKKVKEPAFDMNPSYGLLYRMPRISKNGEIINVYKLRTMHPYAEYLQDYVLKLNGYAETGKPADDFRLTPWGKYLRKYWLDEIPQVINLLKGDLKLVGVRPISKRFFEDIPMDLRELRLNHKPGCIPPYVALNRSGSVESVLQAEREYLEAVERNPLFTDTLYFFGAMTNIIFRRKRSA